MKDFESGGADHDHLVWIVIAVEQANHRQNKFCLSGNHLDVVVNKVPKDGKVYEGQKPGMKTRRSRNEGRDFGNGSWRKRVVTPGNGGQLI